MWRFLLLPSNLTSSFLHLPVEMASSDESGIEQVIASSSALPNKERHTERVLRKKELREFLVIGHTTNLRKNSKISVIWYHGGERWRLNDNSIDSLYLYALDQLSYPAIATECERVFSAAKQILSSERNALGPRMIEACECLRWWWRTGVVVGKMPASAMIPRVEVEA